MRIISRTVITGRLWPSSSLPGILKNEEIAADFLEAGEKTDVDFYFVDGRIVSEYEKDVNIYGTPGALEALREHGIREGTYHSLFLGEVSVTYGGIA